ncbi:MAG: hypothetical protein WCH21_04935 [Bacteroidota bacterium]
MIDSDTLKKDTIVSKKHSKFKISLDYSSNNTYKGKKDTNNLPIITPFVKYTTKSRFFISSSLVHSSLTGKVFDELDLGVGKKIRFSNRWDGSISYSHFFFDSKVSRVKSSVMNDLSSYLGFDSDILYSQLYFDWTQGNKKSKKKNSAGTTNDFIFTFTNSHQFVFDDVFTSGDDITIIPTVDILYGTQNFLATYKGKKDIAYKSYQDQASKFALTSYIFTLYLSYQIKNFVFNVSPYYTIPKNLPAGESTSPYFVMSAGIYYTFISKK